MLWRLWSGLCAMRYPWSSIALRLTCMCPRRQMRSPGMLWASTRHSMGNAGWRVSCFCFAFPCLIMNYSEGFLFKWDDNLVLHALYHKICGVCLKSVIYYPSASVVPAVQSIGSKFNWHFKISYYTWFLLIKYLDYVPVQSRSPMNAFFSIP